MTFFFFSSLWLLHCILLAPVSHTQLQPLRDYLCWAAVVAGRGQWSQAGDALKGEVTGSTEFALRGLFPFLEKEKTLKR